MNSSGDVGIPEWECVPDTATFEYKPAKNMFHPTIDAPPWLCLYAGYSQRGNTPTQAWRLLKQGKECCYM